MLNNLLLHDIKRTYEELEAELAKLQELLKQALDEIARLKEQIKSNSKNSSNLSY